MLGNIQNMLSGLMKNKKFLIIMVVALVFIGLAYYVYTSYIAPRMQPSFTANKEFVEDEGSGKEAELYLFYTEWCPHCKKAKPIWAKLKDAYEGKQVNGVTVHFKEVDCDQDEATADKFKIEGYPTIKLIKDGQVIEYDAKPDYDTLVEFLETSL